MAASAVQLRTRVLGGTPSRDVCAQLDDEDLVARAQGGDEPCMEVILDRYRGYANAKARSFFLYGGDKQDVVQEAMIGLFKAVKDYNPGQEVPFKGFADVCIVRQILTAVKTAGRKKQQMLTSSISLDAPLGEGGHTSLADELPGSGALDPAVAVAAAEAVEDLLDMLRSRLTGLESSVLAMYLEGKDYEEMARTIGTGTKAIDNALQRVKSKVQKHVDTRATL